MELRHRISNSHVRPSLQPSPIHIDIYVRMYRFTGVGQDLAASVIPIAGARAVSAENDGWVGGRRTFDSPGGRTSLFLAAGIARALSILFLAMTGAKTSTGSCILMALFLTLRVEKFVKCGEVFEVDDFIIIKKK